MPRRNAHPAVGVSWSDFALLEYLNKKNMLRPSDHTSALRKRIRSAWFCTKGPRRGFRLRKVSGGENTALDEARWLVREILGEEA